jgi:hypothetical protein
LKQESCYAAAPELTYAKIEALRQAKYFQKRLAKENVKTMRRQLLEFALPHPVIVFDSCCSQLERFDNMIPVRSCCAVVDPSCCLTAQFFEYIRFTRMFFAI